MYEDRQASDQGTAWPVSGTGSTRVAADGRGGPQVPAGGLRGFQSRISGEGPKAELKMGDRQTSVVFLVRDPYSTMLVGKVGAEILGWELW